MSLRADLALLGLAVIGVLSELACVLTGHAAPQLFDQVVIAGLTGAAGVALPSRLAAAPPQASAAPAPAAPAAAVPQLQQQAVPAVAYSGPVGQ